MRVSPEIWQQVLSQLPAQQSLGLALSAEQVLEEVVPLVEDNGMHAHLWSHDHEGQLLFIKGELVSARCGARESVSALEALQDSRMHFDGQSLPLEHARAVLALTHGSPRSRVPDTWQELHLSLYQEVFTGCVVQESDQQSQLCLWVDGTPLNPLADVAGGVFHVLEVPHPLPANILLTYRTYQQQKRNAEIHSLWFRLEVILREFVGKGAPSALQHLKHLHRSSNPGELRDNLRTWIQETLDDDALAMFDA